MACLKAQDIVLSSQEAEISPYQGTLFEYTSKSGNGKRKDMLVDTKTGFILEFIYTINTVQHYMLPVGNEKAKLLQSSTKDSLSHYYLIDFNNRRFYDFDTEKTLLSQDSLENIRIGIAFEKFSRKKNESYLKEMDKQAVTSKSDTVFFDKTYQVLATKSTMAPEFETIHYIFPAPIRPFPLSGSNIAGKGLKGVYGGYKIIYHGQLYDEKIFTLEDSISPEDQSLVTELIAKIK
jgi:hypothetical protein